MFSIALVGPELEENLSLRYLASSLAAAGFEAAIVPFNESSDLPRVLSDLVGREDPPALVGLSLSFQWRAKDFLALAVALRRQGYTGHITAGGHFGTFACREILRDFHEVDSICRHEAEDTLVSLATALRSGGSLESIRGLAYREANGDTALTELAAPPDLARLPRPDRRGTPSECLGRRMAPLVASRGCYGHCAFCCIAAWHEQTMPGKRFRLRSVADVADEMAELYHERGIELFLFHDDNFFLPGHSQSLRRIESLADELERRGVRGFATIVKARPNDLQADVLHAMRQRLGLIRIYVGIENASERGLRNLQRGVDCEENHRALDLLDRAGVFPCFNLLIFEPSTTLADLEANLRFMERHAAAPMNFARVELYAGTPLLAQLQADHGCTGDYLAWDYRIADPAVQRVFEIATECFYRRNFSEDATAHRLMQTRFRVEIAARFHAPVFCESWRGESKRLSVLLTLDSVRALREAAAFVQSNPRSWDDIDFAAALSASLRATEGLVHAATDALDLQIESAVRAAMGGNRHGREEDLEAAGKTA
jgi:radical SAM superfamily enzyme YgiQ (UPF0313 family)